MVILENRLFPFEGITLGYHSLTHHGKRPELLKELSIIERFYAKEFFCISRQTERAHDTDGRPLLDSTAVLFGSGMGNKLTSAEIFLFFLLGGFRRGNHHRFERHQRDGRPLGDLFVSILQQFEIEQDNFFESWWQSQSFTA